MQDWFPFHCSCHWNIRSAQCLLSQLCIVARPPLRCWCGIGWWPCALDLVHRVCPCCRQRNLDGCVPLLLDCGNNLGGSACLGILFPYESCDLIFVHSSHLTHAQESMHITYVLVRFSVVAEIVTLLFCILNAGCHASTGMEVVACIVLDTLFCPAHFLSTNT